MTETLKFPKSEFTHTELAQANGKTNQQVWNAYQKAIKDGIIVSAGTRKNPKGKGKPSLLWKVAEGTPVPLVDKVVVAPTAVAAEVKTEAAAPIVPTEPVIEPALAPIEPVKAPEAEVITVEVLRIEPAAEPAPVKDKMEGVRTLDKCPCPVCGNPTLAMDDATGVKVWCGQGSDVCPPQDVSGHGRNDKDAYETLTDKFKFAMKGVH